MNDRMTIVDVVRALGRAMDAWVMEIRQRFGMQPEPKLCPIRVPVRGRGEQSHAGNHGSQPG